ncbi:hypothetical protein [Agromyces bauzanensis]
MPRDARRLRGDPMHRYEGQNVVAYEFDVILGILALVALIIGIAAFVIWIVAPRAGATPRATRGLLRLWIAALTTAALSGLVAFIIGRDVLGML